jgi:asparagine synthase (glutamine-hydrolysing)
MTGGLDSSTVAISALSHLNDQERLPTFTWIPVDEWDGRCRPGTYGDERPFVEAIAAMHPRLDPTFVRSEGHGLFHHLDEILDYSGIAPRNAINLCWAHDIFAEAQARGVSVLLEGGAGNMSLSWDGRNILLEYFKTRSYGKLIQELFAGKPSARVFAYRLVKMLLLPLAPDVVNAAYLRARGHTRKKPLWHKFSAINPDFAEIMKIDERLSFYGFDYFMKPYTGNLRKLLLGDSFTGDNADFKQGFRALYGVETRDPLNNRKLVEWCTGLPENQFWRLGESRWLVKRLMQSKLPSQVLSNRKVGEQVIDWHVRMTRELPQIREELAAIADDPDTCRYIDIKRIRGFLDDWPSQTPLKPKSGHTYSYIPVSIGAALAAGRFVRRMKGANR